MFASLKMWWVAVRDGLWLVPALFTSVGAALALTVARLEQRSVIQLGGPEHWILGGGAEGARGVLTAIAGGLITVTGVVFSVTIVALQLASSQFTPRLLRNFTADRSNQVVLGVFIGTFTYTLLVLREVTSEFEGQDAFVPRVAVAIAVVLVLVSIGFLIFFIHHAARSIQIAVILERVTHHALRRVEEVFPKTFSESDAVTAPAAQEAPQGRPHEIRTQRAGYFQAIDKRRLFSIGKETRLVVRMERRIGEFVYPGQVLANVWSDSVVEGALEEAICAAFVQGSERTAEQDPDLGLIEISDIAIKALSPGINDPTTAFTCIDRLGEVLLARANRYALPHVRSEEGSVTLIPLLSEFQRAVGLSFDQIAHFGASNPALLGKLLDVVASLIELVPPARQPPLVELRERVLQLAREELENDVDRAGVERAAARPRSGSSRL